MSQIQNQQDRADKISRRRERREKKWTSEFEAAHQKAVALLSSLTEPPTIHDDIEDALIKGDRLTRAGMQEIRESITAKYPVQHTPTVVVEVSPEAEQAKEQ
jgi:hypothetical protein